MLILPRGLSYRTVLLFLGSFLCCAVHAQRVANTTLQVPEIPATYGYQIVTAFPNLTFGEVRAIVTPPGDNRLFVVEGRGTISVIADLNNPTKTTFLDLTDIIWRYNEGGLLGLAFHPNWRQNRQFFVFYTTAQGVPSGSLIFDRISRFEIDPQNPNRALRTSERPLISQADREGNHNGGDVHFGPDGYLYVSLGDEGGAGDPHANSRYIDKNFFSTILRIDVDKRAGNPEPNSHAAVHRDAQGRAYYSVPADNPFIGRTRWDIRDINPANVRTEFFVGGLRNPYRFSFDPGTGVLFCGDVGQGTREEINVIERGGDYGWTYKEGFYKPSWVTIPAGLTLADPILDYPRSSGPSIPGPSGSRLEGTCVIGGIVARGSRFSGLEGMYVFADWGTSRIFGFRYNPSTRQVTDLQQLTTSSQPPAAFGRDPSNGDILIATELGTTLQRLIYSNTPVEGQPIPARLSQTGAFSNLGSLSPQPGILPYEINVPFWSDNGIKRRWFSIPDINDRMTFSASGNWGFPSGTVWIKHFDLETTNGVASSRRRLETRFLVKNDRGIHGFTYRWNSAQTDADLVAEGGTDESIAIYNSNGSLLRQQQWRYPSRGECLQCHTTPGGFALGFNTSQINRTDAGGSQNQLSMLSQYGYFTGTVPSPSTLSALVPANNSSASLEVRVRSYLAANCVQCHQPGGSAQGLWDARFSTPTDQAGIIDGALVNNFGDSANRVIRLGSLSNSILYQRIATMGQWHMPPIATSVLNDDATMLLQSWIQAGTATAPSAPRNLRIVNP